MTDAATHTTSARACGDLFTYQPAPKTSETEAERRFRTWATAAKAADRTAAEWQRHKQCGFEEARAYDATCYHDAAAHEALTALVQAPVKSAEDALAILAAVAYAADLFGESAHGMGLSLRDLPGKLAFHLPADIYDTYRS